MIQGNGNNQSAASVAEGHSEPAMSEVQTSAPVVSDLPTRSKQRAKQDFQHNRFVIIGAGALVVALLLFVAVSVPHRRPAKTNTTGDSFHATSSTGQPVAPTADKSLLPIIDSGKPVPQETHEGMLGEDDVQRTATRKPTPARSIASPKVGPDASLASIPPFPEQWQPPPYRDDGEAKTSNQDKAEHQTFEAASLVYAREVHSTKNNTTSQGVAVSHEPVLSLGLPTGTRLRARLESAASTALRMPVVAVVEYNYEREGEIIVPAGAKAVGRVQQADRSGCVTIQFDSLMMPDGTSVPIQGVATDLNLRPPKGRVEGRNTGKNVLLRSLSGVGQVGALLAGRGNLSEPLSEGDILRERVSNNIGRASDEQVSGLVLTEHLVVTIQAGTTIYVVLEQTAKGIAASAGAADSAPVSTSVSTEELRQLLQLQRELRQTAISEDK
jgi:Bacterial conjugation TrbI-like protein